MQISMPEMNGLELLEQLKRDDPNNLVFMLTAFDRTLDSLRGKADDYIPKPIDHNYLSYSIKRVLKTKTNIMELEKLKNCKEHS